MYVTESDVYSYPRDIITWYIQSNTTWLNTKSIPFYNKYAYRITQMINCSAMSDISKIDNV